MRKVVTAGKRTSPKLKDLEFITHTLGSNETERISLTRLLGDEEARDEILDHPNLLEVIRNHPEMIDISDHLFFYIIVRHQLLARGIDDRDLTEYVSAILAKQNQASQWEESEIAPFGIPYEEVVLRQQIESTRRYDHFFIYAHAAECNLLAVSVHHGYLNRRVERYGAPGVHFYESRSLSHFMEARDHPLAREFEMRELYDGVISEFGGIVETIRETVVL